MLLPSAVVERPFNIVNAFYNQYFQASDWIVNAGAVNSVSFSNVINFSPTVVSALMTLSNVFRRTSKITNDWTISGSFYADWGGSVSWIGAGLFVGGNGTSGQQTGISVYVSGQSNFSVSAVLNLNGTNIATVWSSGWVSSFNLEVQRKGMTLFITIWTSGNKPQFPTYTYVISDSYQYQDNTYGVNGLGQDNPSGVRGRNYCTVFSFKQNDYTSNLIYDLPNQTGNKITISSALPIANTANERPTMFGVAGYLG